jgi:hypothetical protein
MATDPCAFVQPDPALIIALGVGGIAFSFYLVVQAARGRLPITPIALPDCAAVEPLPSPLDEPPEDAQPRCPAWKPEVAVGVLASLRP